MTCQARREGDELVCRACRLRWDVNDAERPECRTTPKLIAKSRNVRAMMAQYDRHVPFASGLSKIIR